MKPFIEYLLLYIRLIFVAFTHWISRQLSHLNSFYVSTWLSTLWSLELSPTIYVVACFRSFDLSDIIHEVGPNSWQWWYLDVCWSVFHIVRILSSSTHNVFRDLGPAVDRPTWNDSAAGISLRSTWG